MRNALWLDLHDEAVADLILARAARSLEANTVRDDNHELEVRRLRAIHQLVHRSKLSRLAHKEAWNV